MALAYICQGDYIRGFKWLLEANNLNSTTPNIAKLSFAIFYFNNGDYLESLKCLERLTHLEVPFVKLLHLAAQGKLMNKKNENIDAAVLALAPNTRSIIDRMIFDEKLKNGIFEGLKAAAFKFN